MSVEITERKRMEQRSLFMVDELNHRVKNTLATVQAIAAQTLEGADGGGYLAAATATATRAPPPSNRAAA